MKQVIDNEPSRLIAEDADSETARALARLPSAEPPLGARERVWARMTMVAPRRFPVWTLAPVALAVGLLVLGGLRAGRSTPTATLSLAAGSVELAPIGHTWSQAHAGQTLPVHTQMRTDHGRAFVRFGGAGALLREGTVASVTRTGLPWAAEDGLALERGAVVVASAGKFTVATPQWRVSTAGSTFSVEADADFSVEVRVRQGVVQIDGPAAAIYVHAGESWTNQAGSGHAPIDAADGAVAEALAHPQADEAVVRIEGPSGVDVSGDGVPLGPLPVSWLAPVGTREIAPARQGPVAAEQMKVALGRDNTVHLALTKTPPQAPAPRATATPVAVPSPIVAATPPGSDSAQVAGGPLSAHSVKRQTTPAASDDDRAELSYQLAEELEKQGRWADAATAYQRAAEGNGSRAELSLYEVGRLRMKYLSDPGGAARAFRLAHDRFPRGALAPEVGLSLIESLLADGQLDAATVVIDDFLDQQKSNERRDDVRLIRGNVRRQRGDWVRALDDYLLLLQAPGKIGEDALYFAGVCEERAGQPGAAQARWKEYQERFPAGRHHAEVETLLRRGR